VGPVSGVLRLALVSMASGPRGEVGTRLSCSAVTEPHGISDWAFVTCATLWASNRLSEKGWFSY
jgi:hypothetical protein